ncbi:MAG: hypothetical protein LBI04_06845, partial [Treponema sp.]|nr:hypothetical protein [Treponema sp.]
VDKANATNHRKGFPQSAVLQNAIYFVYLDLWHTFMPHHETKAMPSHKIFGKLWPQGTSTEPAG